LGSVTTSFDVFNNVALQSFDGFIGLTTVGTGMTIIGNTNLQNINGIFSVSSVGSSGIQIYGNPSLTSVAGMCGAKTLSPGSSLQLDGPSMCCNALNEILNATSGALIIPPTACRQGPCNDTNNYNCSCSSLPNSCLGDFGCASIRPFTCKVQICQTLSSAANYDLTISNNNTYPSTASYQCLANNLTAARTCKKDGTWAGVAPSCLASCACNGWSNTCDLGGICSNCGGNTTGNYCESCLPYTARISNATNAACTPCSKNTTGVNCELCKAGYYHNSLGACVGCQCNNRTSTCTDTGICISCASPYAGDSCDQCLTGWYRDTISNTCKPCNCNGFSCYATNGTCQCGNYTTGASCASCQSFTYRNVNTSQCEPCNCNGFSNTCDTNGICQDCSLRTSGNHCESCITGYYYHNSTSGCLPCDCSFKSTTCLLNGTCTDCKFNTTGDHCELCIPGFSIQNIGTQGDVWLRCMPNQFLQLATSEAGATTGTVVVTLTTLVIVAAVGVAAVPAITSAMNSAQSGAQATTQTGQAAVAPAASTGSSSVINDVILMIYYSQFVVMVGMVGNAQPAFLRSFASSFAWVAGIGSSSGLKDMASGFRSGVDADEYVDDTSPSRRLLAVNALGQQIREGGSSGVEYFCAALGISPEQIFLTTLICFLFLMLGLVILTLLLVGIRLLLARMCCSCTDRCLDKCRSTKCGRCVPKKTLPFSSTDRDLLLWRLSGWALRVLFLFFYSLASTTIFQMSMKPTDQWFIVTLAYFTFFILCVGLPAWMHFVIIDEFIRPIRQQSQIRNSAVAEGIRKGTYVQQVEAATRYLEQQQEQDPIARRAALRLLRTDRLYGFLYSAYNVCHCPMLCCSTSLF
jgi:hypothetical protein